MFETHWSLKKLTAALAGVLLLASGCGPSGGTSSTSSSKPAPPTTVVVVHPQRKALRRMLEQPGVVQAYEETQLFARVPGYVRRLRAEVDIGCKIRGPKYDSTGRQVEPGEVLAELAVPELEQKVKQKEAMVRQVEAEVNQALKTVAVSEASIAMARAAVIETQSNFDRWESESKRMTGLAKDRVVDSQSDEETLSQFRAAGGRRASANATVQKAQADRDRAEADVQAARAREDVARAGVLRAETMLGYGKIRAPYDGVVTSRKANTGDFVQPGNGSSDWLFRVARLEPVRIVLAVAEADADLVQVDAEVKMAAPSLANPMLAGKVTRTSWALEPGSRTLRTEVELLNKDGRLRPGMYIHAEIVSQMSEAWTLPTAAVVKQADATVCFLIEGGKAARTPLQVGRSDGKFIMVLKRRKSDGATWEDCRGDEAVAARANGLIDGQSVQQAEAPK